MIAPTTPSDDGCTGTAAGAEGGGARPQAAGGTTASVPAVIGDSPALRVVIARALRIAPHPTSVLVTGESGTGKELFARLLHDHGPAPRGPFVAVNCGALARELAESELFGHERGAFTGAAGRRTGWFEEASGGTLVLDEVGELPLELQPKLLRVLETGCLRRVGGQGEVAVRVRIIALTLRDLEEEAARGRFRIDLYHRLSGLALRLPPLRARREDIPRLASHFVRETAAELGRPLALTPAALARLGGHAWPGNVRELRNVIRRAGFLCEPDEAGVGVIDADALELGGPAPAERAAEDPAPPPTRPAAPAVPAGVGDGDGNGEQDVLRLRGRSYKDLQQEILLWALRQHGGSRRRAARALGISRSTFCDRIKRLTGAQGGGDAAASDPGHRAGAACTTTAGRAA